MWGEFVELFTQMSWIVILLFSFGIVFCIIEACVPGFGIWGITGIIFEVAGVVLHAVFSGSAFQVLILIIILTLLTVALFLILVRSAKYGALSKSAFVEKKSSIPENYGDEMNKLGDAVIGEEGVVTSDCRPVGKLTTKVGTMEVYAIKDFIERGSKAKIISVENSKIYIEKIKEQTND